MRRRAKRPRPSLDAAAVSPHSGADDLRAVIIVEHPDPAGERWQAALALLLEAGRAAAATDVMA